MNEELYKDIDEALVPFHEHVNGMLAIEGEVYDDENGVRMNIYEVDIESPLQLDVIVNEAGEVIIGSSPPLYYMETGVMPVFHGLRIRAVVEQSKHTAI